jgi:hypothetical protein
MALVSSAALAACSVGEGARRTARAAGEREPTPFPDLAFEVVELAHDGAYPVPSDPARPRVVDANSVLSVRFHDARPVAEPGAPAPGRAELLERARLAAQQHAAVLAEAERLDASDPAAVAAFSARVDAQALGFVELLAGFARFLRLSRPGLGEDEAAAEASAVLGRGVQDGVPPVFQNLVAWLEVEGKRRQRELDQVLARRAATVVTVEAFLHAQGKTDVALHVANYDTLPAGVYRPIDRYRLRLTPAEEATLRRELADAAADAQLVRGLLAAAEEVKQGWQRLIAKAEAEAGQAWGAIEAALADDDALRQAADLVRGLATSAAEPAVREAAADLAAGLDRIRSDLAGLRTQRDAVLAALAALRAGRSADLADLVLGRDPVHQAVAALVAAFDATRAWVDLLPALAAGFDRVLPAVADAAASDVLRRVRGLLEGVRGAGGRGILPLLVELRDRLFAPRDLDVVQAADRARGIEHRIPRPVDDLPEGTVELARAGVAPGDRISLVVTFSERALDAGTGPPPPPRPVASTRFLAEVRLTGFHRHIGGKLIFNRAADGTTEATKWKPNVAALADWRYLVRDPNWLGRTWNFLDPGLGLHVASLDHGTDAVEVGVGFSATLFDGFVSAGYGWNLSVDRDRDYFFLGIDLFDVLRKAQDGVIE